MLEFIETSWNYVSTNGTNVATLNVGYSAVLVMMMLLFVARKLLTQMHHVKEEEVVKDPKTVPKTNTTTKNTKVRKGVVCPFSLGTDFTIELAEHLPLSPLEKFEDWVEDYDITPQSLIQPSPVAVTQTAKNTLKPLAARFLNLGISGQDTPGILRAGLRRLRNSKYLLLEEPHRLPYEFMLKKKIYDDPKRFPEVFVALQESLEAQRECLDLFLDYLPRRYPDQYLFDKEWNTITVKCIDAIFRIADYYDTRPLELCVRIVQEDLVLMCPPSPDGAARGESYFMAAAGVVFSSEDMPKKLGQPLEFLHAPVPGYEQHIRKSMNLTFSKLKPEQPMWRTNWGIAPHGDLEKPLYGSEETLNMRTMSSDGVTLESIRSKFLKVEYQTIRRLPKTLYLLFAVNTMIDPLFSLEELPMAASCLAASIRGMSPAMRKYKGIDNDEVCEVVLKYLDSIGIISPGST